MLQWMESEGLGAARGVKTIWRIVIQIGMGVDRESGGKESKNGFIYADMVASRVVITKFIREYARLAWA